MSENGSSVMLNHPNADAEREREEEDKEPHADAKTAGPHGHNDTTQHTLLLLSTFPPPARYDVTKESWPCSAAAYTLKTVGTEASPAPSTELVLSPRVISDDHCTGTLGERASISSPSFCPFRGGGESWCGVEVVSGFSTLSGFRVRHFRVWVEGEKPLDLPLLPGKLEPTFLGSSFLRGERRCCIQQQVKSIIRTSDRVILWEFFSFLCGAVRDAAPAVSRIYYAACMYNT